MEGQSIALGFLAWPFFGHSIVPIPHPHGYLVSTYTLLHGELPETQVLMVLLVFLASCPDSHQVM